MLFVLNPTWNFSKYRSGPTCTVLNALTHKREIQFMHILTRNYSKKIIQGKAPLTKIDQFWFLICVFETLDGICVVRVEPTQHREIQL